MGQLSILQVVKQLVIPKIGLASPNDIYSAGASRELVELQVTIRDAIRAIMFDRDAHEWQAIQSTHIITGDGTASLFDMPADFARFLKPAAIWSNKLQRNMTQVTDSNEWLAMTERNIGLTTGSWRMRGDQVEIYPTPVNAETFKFEYISNYVNAAKNKKMTFNDDGDIFRLDDDLLGLAIVWKWREMKGLPYAERLADYNAHYASLVSDDGGSHIIVDRQKMNYGSSPTYHGATIVDSR